MRPLAGSSAPCRRTVGLTLSRYDVLGSLKFGFRPDGRQSGCYYQFGFVLIGVRLALARPGAVWSKLWRRQRGDFSKVRRSEFPQGLL
jgi:hypothetical protein